MIKFSDVCNLYLGCRVVIPKQQKYYGTKIYTVANFSIYTKKLTVFLDDRYIGSLHSDDTKPILRTLSSISEDETKSMNEYIKGMSFLAKNAVKSGLITFKETWLLKNHFDLFDLITNQLAVDSNFLINDELNKS